MKKVFAFDFDGTLTTRDTLLIFLRDTMGVISFVLGFLRYLPWLVLMKLHLYDNGKAKERVFSYFFKGMPLEQFNALCEAFASTHQYLLRPDMLQILREALAEGADVYVVSASVDNWVQPFFTKQNLEVKVLGTEVEVVDGYLTGRFLTPNCYGPEKVARLETVLPPREDYHLTAYGDSRGDSELLAFADERHLLKSGYGATFKIFTLLVILLNALFIYRMSPLFQQEGFGPYWKVFERELHLSGYDPLTYLGVTDWDVVYNVFRHPLLAFLIWPLWLINQGLTALFGVNCVQYLVALPLILSSVGSYVCLYRILRHVVCLRHRDATLLSAFYFSMAYIMLSVIVPDHFTISMFLLLLTLYVSGRCLREGRQLSLGHTALLFMITGGVTLSNGVKTFLSAFFVNGKSFFRPKYLFMAVILPAALLWGVAQWEYHTYVLPKEKARQEARVRKQQRIEQQVAQLTPQERQRYEQREEQRQRRIEAQKAKSGTPMKQHGFWKWTDVTTSRVQTIYENLFGETIQFHRQHFLEDTLVFRPVFVKYEWVWNYLIEALILLLSAVGLWCGRRSRFLWMAMFYFAFDMFIHLVLGFGINEIFIMAPHWLFVLPLAIAYAFRSVTVTQGTPSRLQRLRLRSLRLTIVALTFYLLAYNATLLIHFLLTPLNTTL